MANSFVTAVNCMDGRAQEPVIAHLKAEYGARYVDMVTEAGPVRHLAESDESGALASIVERCTISIERHGSPLIAVVAHHDCAGNPVADEVQREQLRRARDRLAQRFPEVEVVALWLDERFTVHRL